MYESGMYWLYKVNLMHNIKQHAQIFTFLKLFNLFKCMHEDQKFLLGISYAIVYQKKGNILGVALIAENETHETLKLILVLPIFQKKGIAGEILDFWIAESELKKTKIPRISFHVLHVGEKNDIFQNNARIFVRRGFTTKSKSLDNLETYLQLSSSYV